MGLYERKQDESKFSLWFVSAIGLYGLIQLGLEKGRVKRPSDDYCSDRTEQYEVQRETALHLSLIHI